MQLQELIDAMERIAPTRYAESWDNVGLLVGDANQSITRVMLTIDYTPAVADEAKSAGCDAIIAYHPPIFDGIKRVTADSATELIHDAIRRGVAIYSPHTALDVAEGGTNDVLADAIGLKDRAPLRLNSGSPQFCKLVVFVPTEHLQAVSHAVFTAGAGQLGNYACCSFLADGTGTFLPLAGADPAIGKIGELEEVQEFRFETIVPISKSADVIAAMRLAHPYEEPAFDLIQLMPSATSVGIGRIGKFESPTLIDDVAALLKRSLNLSHVMIAKAKPEVRTVSICAGAGGTLLEDAIKQKSDLFITGELRHHDALKAVRAGMSVICTLHSNSERATLSRLKARLEKECPGIEYRLSAMDRDPFEVV